MSYRQIPNGLTLSRILAAAPFFLLAYWSADNPWCHGLALLLFIYIMLSDFWDGWLARRWNAVTALGKELDPIADKVVVAAAYIAVASLHRHWALPILTFTLVFRDFLVSLLRGFAARFRFVIAARPSGKLRTFFSMGFALLLLARAPYPATQPPWLLQWLHAIPPWFIDAGIWTLMAWTLYSLYDYWNAHRRFVWHLFTAPEQ